MSPHEPSPSRETLFTLILWDSVRRLRSDLERPGGPHATREGVTVLRENVARWLENRAKPA